MEDKAEQPKKRGFRKHSDEPKPDPLAKGFKKYLKSQREVETWEFADAMQDPLRIDPEVRDRYRREGIDFMWASTACMGAPQNENIAAKQKSGWEFVAEGDFPTADIPRVEYQNMHLVARDWRLSKRQAKIQEVEATEPIRVLKQRAGEGDLPGVTLDARHARGHNKIRSTFEKLEIPTE
jgi:hypothetical protein